MKDKTVCVVGLGYVGLPLAKAFSKHLKTIGFDIDRAKIKKLNEKNNDNLICSSDPSLIKQADFVIIAVAQNEFKNKPFLSTGSFFRKNVLNDNPVLIDVRGVFNEEYAERKGFYYRAL